MGKDRGGKRKVVKMKSGKKTSNYTVTNTLLFGSSLTNQEGIVISSVHEGAYFAIKGTLAINSDSCSNIKSQKDLKYKLQNKVINALKEMGADKLPLLGPGHMVSIKINLFAHKCKKLVYHILNLLQDTFEHVIYYNSNSIKKVSVRKHGILQRADERIEITFSKMPSNL